MSNRKNLLEDLLNLSRPISEILDDLSNYSWDSEVTYINVSKYHVFKVLRSALNDEISLEDIEDWSNALESREDIEFESEKLYQIIVELANPILYGKLSNEKIINYLNKLNK